MLRNALLLAVLGAAGCQGTASASGSCSFNSECVAPLVCAAGRCRAECVTARDCTYPLDCVITASGLGACQVHEDESCRPGASDCAAPLECLDGRCRQPCETTNECAIGMVCGASATACERPTTLPGTCDPVGDQGCSATTTCAVIAGSAQCVELATAAASTGDVGDACTGDATCRAGLVCPSNQTSGIGAEVGRTERRCLRPCQLDPMTSCGLGTRCMRLDQQAVGWATPELPTGLGICSEACDPLADTGCPVHETCLVYRLADAFPTYCSPTTPSGGDFATCNGDYECAGHRMCETPPMSSDPTRVCRPICDPSATTGCPSGSHCVDGGAIDTGEHVGLCVRDTGTP